MNFVVYLLVHLVDGAFFLGKVLDAASLIDFNRLLLSVVLSHPISTVCNRSMTVFKGLH